MPLNQYGKWIVVVTLPADDHKLQRPMDVTASGDEVRLLNKVLPSLNPDMRVVGEPKFYADHAEFKTAWDKANADARKQDGWKEPGRYDLQLTQAGIEKIWAERQAALAKLRAPAATAKSGKPANG